MTTRAHGAGSWWRRAATVAAAAACGIALVPDTSLSAHTEASAVAVPAGSEATVTFAPEHGCGESPTVGVRIQAPVADARAEAVDGWTVTATSDGTGNTVLEWTGGSVPADEPGAFPVGFTVPDAVGTLLAFPAVQRCANGAELAWIGTAPGDEFPAPQVLVLGAGSEPAATLEDVPADAPGRELLVALATGAAPDDNPAAPATSAAPATAAPVTPAPTTAAPATVAPTTTATSTEATVAPGTAPTTTVPTPTTTEGDGGGGSSAGWVIAVIVAVIAIGAAAAVVYARRRGG